LRQQLAPIPQTFREELIGNLTDALQNERKKYCTGDMAKLFGYLNSNTVQCQELVNLTVCSDAYFERLKNWDPGLYEAIIGWWYTYPSEKSIRSSIGMMTFPYIPNIWKVIKVMFQTTNQISH